MSYEANMLFATAITAIFAFPAGWIIQDYSRYRFGNIFPPVYYALFTIVFGISMPIVVYVLYRVTGDGGWSMFLMSSVFLIAFVPWYIKEQRKKNGK